MSEEQKKQYEEAMNKAYTEAGHNAFFGNGFMRGCEHAHKSMESLLSQKEAEIAELRELVADWERRYARQSSLISHTKSSQF